MVEPSGSKSDKQEIDEGGVYWCFLSKFEHSYPYLKNFQRYFLDKI